MRHRGPGKGHAFLRARTLLTFAALASAIAMQGCGDDSKPVPTDTVRPPDLCAPEECRGGRCDPLKGCVSCLFDSDCGQDSRCVDRACKRVVACERPADCDDGVCDLNVHECVVCVQDQDCAGTAHCVAEHCVPYTPCDAQSDCGAGERCNTHQGECVECLDDGDCATREACKAQRCVARCASDSDCGGARCGGDGLCTQCLSSADCPDVYHCAAGSCQLDVCEAKASCARNGDAVKRCNAAADGFDIEPCGASGRCQVLENEAACRETLCKPGAWGCDAENRRATLCSSDGFKLEETVDCSETAQVCSEGACVTLTCVPGSRRCAEDGVLLCDASGLTEELEPCGQTERCDVDSATCVERTCEPGDAVCDAETISLCNAEGSGYEPSDMDCSESGKACWGGECLPRVCIGEHVCADDDSAACLDNGTRVALAERCGFDVGTFCNSDTGLCEPFLCEPGKPICDGDSSTSCADDGSGPAGPSIDCSALGRVCWAADCLPTICTDSHRCDGQDLLRCEHKGTALVAEETCGAGTVCDAAAGTCRRQKCLPTRPACNGSLATTCDPTGLGYEGDAVDCSLGGDVCFEGECLPVVCVPGEIYCNGNEIRHCGPSGATWSVLQSCPESQFCREGQGACLPDVCIPSSAVCSGNVATRCMGDGSGPEPRGLDCGSANVCERGVCRPLICTPSQRFCRDGDVYLCNATGTDSAAIDNCKQSEYCGENSVGQVSCLADL